MTITQIIAFFRDIHIIRVIIVTFTKRSQIMKDPADKKTRDLLGDKQQVKRGRPTIGRTAMTTAERKRGQRARQRAALVAPAEDGGKAEADWTAQECLLALQTMPGTPTAKAAWEQLGKLHGYCSRPQQIEIELALHNAKIAASLIAKAEAIEAMVKSGEKSKAMLATARGHREAAASIM